MSTVKASELREWLIKHERCFISTAEASELLGVSPDKLPDALRQTRKRREIARVCKGGWAAVNDPDPRNGYMPPQDFIHDMMSHLGADYQIGYIAAAEAHGASHRASPSAPVLTTARFSSPVDKSRYDLVTGLSPVYREDPLARGWHKITWKSKFGTRPVFYSTPTITLLDCVNREDQVGGFGNMMNIIALMGIWGNVSPSKLAEDSFMYPNITIQKLGALLDYATCGVLDTGPLRDALPNKLHRTQLARGRYFFPGAEDPAALAWVDKRWQVIFNRNVEIDALSTRVGHEYRN